MKDNSQHVKVKNICKNTKNFNLQTLSKKKCYICNEKHITNYKKKNNMCLYEIQRKNPKYEINAKNKGNVPQYRDIRLTTIRTKCGWCEECRKEKANEWQIRLTEEIKDNQKGEFVTLSYSPEAIAKLEKEVIEKKYKGIEGNEIDVNIIAAYSIRMFTERWRKKYKKAPRHWFVTELGHKNSERLHLHGIMWRTEDTTKEEYQKDICEKWQYGNIYIGKFVDERTASYITKYITKTDFNHKGYREKTFASKKIGATYIDRMRYWHAYRGEKTIQYYKNSKGYKLKLPKYYKEKLWTDEERENLWLLNVDRGITSINKTEYEINRQEEEQYRKNYINHLNNARSNNTAAGYGSNESNNKKYIITDIMKLKSYEIIRYDRQKLVQSVRRREIDKVLKWKEQDEARKDIGKDLYIDTIIYGNFIGTTTERERKLNAEKKEAQSLGVNIKTLRLIKKGILTYY